MADFPRILVEEFAQGPYFLADIMGNTIIEIGAGDFGPPPNFVYREYTYPASLTHDQRTRITDVSLSCLGALDLNWGPTNIEFRWTERGPVVIEVNPRLAGSPDPQLIQLACGVDLVTEHIKLVIGDECDLRKKHSQTASARFLVPDRAGTLDRIDGADQAAGVPGVAEVTWYIRPPTPIIMKGDCRDCIGHVIAASPTPTQTSAILQRAVDSITWSITPFPTLRIGTIRYLHQRRWTGLRNWEKGDKWGSARLRSEWLQTGETMSKKPGPNHSRAFKAEVALVAVKRKKTLAELVQRSDVHPNRMGQWRAQLRGGAAAGGPSGLHAYLRRERHGPVPRLPAW